MPVSYELTGKTAVVTGGAGGIGGAVAERLRVSGARVFVWDLGRREHDGIVSLDVDVTKADQVAAAVTDTLAEGATIDILVNSVGTLGSYARDLNAGGERVGSDPRR